MMTKVYFRLYFYRMHVRRQWQISFLLPANRMHVRRSHVSAERVERTGRACRRALENKISARRVLDVLLVTTETNRVVLPTRQ